MLRLIKRDKKEATEFEQPTPAKTAADVATFVDHLAKELFFDGPERRAETRLRITLPVVCTPLDEHFASLGYSVRAVTRDISPSGVGLMCPDPIATQYVAIRLESLQGEQLDAVAEVLRCQPLGFYYDVGGKFVTEMHQGGF
jgi:hypothetical protein